MRYILGLLILLWASPSWAIRAQTQWETDCTGNQTYSKVGVAGSSIGVRGYGIGYAIYAQGGTVDFRVAHTTRTYNTYGVAPSSVTSAVISITSGAVLGYQFKALTVNPTITIDALGLSTTANVYIDYCEDKK